MNEDRVRERITQLRIQKGVSEYQMSYDLGHSKNYMQNISSGRALPSFSEFLYICEYFGVTPMEFFNEENPLPMLVQQVLDGAKKLQEDDLRLLLVLIGRLGGKE